LRFACSDQKKATALEQYKELIADELNVKTVTREDNLDELVNYVYKPNLKTLGPKYGKLLGVIRKELPTYDGEALAPLRAGEEVTITLGGEEVTLTPDDVLISVEQASDWASADSDGIQIALSTELTDELIREGMARDMIRHIQQARKDADLEENQRIQVSWSTNCDAELVTQAISEWSSTIKSETRADAVDQADAVDGKSVSLGDVSVVMAIQS